MCYVAFYDFGSGLQTHIFGARFGYNKHGSHHLFFFFQAEDGIRDLIVTGVQTCALPISITASGVIDRSHTRRSAPAWRSPPAMRSTVTALPRTDGNANGVTTAIRSGIAAKEIGRASCRERV